MILTRMVSVFFLIFILYSCIKDVNELEKSLDYIENNWIKEKVIAYASKPEGTAMIEVDKEFALDCQSHFFTSPKDSSLIKFFERYKIYEQLDMEVLTLTSFHRRINNLPILLQEQINEIHIRNKPINMCEKKLVQYSIGLYNSLNIGDIIRIELPIDERDHNNAILFGCPGADDWIKNPAPKGVTIFAIIENKRIDEFVGEILSVNIQSLSNPSIMILMENKEINDKLEIELRFGYFVEKIDNPNGARINN